MPVRKKGKRHRLLTYSRSMNRLWKLTLVVGLMLLAIWWWSYDLFPLLQPLHEALLFAAAFIVLLLSAFTFLSRNMTYVQPYPDHLRLVTPFLRLKISYRRIRSVHPSQLQKLFPLENLSGDERRALEPFTNKTILLLELTDYPINPRILRLFLSKHTFNPVGTGLVFIVDDWMVLSTEIDSFIDLWRQAKSPPRKGFGILQKQGRRR
jgi:hypothetical protein